MSGDHKKVVVFANGVFDLLHPGHLALLRFAKGLGDVLVVGLNSDQSVKMLKGPTRPIHDQQLRKKNLEALGFVDEVIIFDGLRPTATILALNPTIVVKGGECEPEEVRRVDEVPDHIKIVMAPLLMETPDEKYSTTRIIKYMSPSVKAIENFKKAKIVVIGDIMLDKYTFGDIDRVSPEASVPIVVKRAEKSTLGGAANAAHNLASLGAQVALAGVTGKDESGALVLKLLQEKGIGTDAILVLPHRITIEKHRIVSGDNHQLLRLDLERKDNLTTEEEEYAYALIEPLIKENDAIIFSDYGKGFFSEKFAQKLIALARTEKKLMLADFNSPKHKRYFMGVDIITPNLKEARELTGLHDIEEIGPWIVHDMGVHAVITRGGEGMSLFRREDASHYHVPGKKIRVFDVSGAGDTSIATLALGLVAGLELTDAVTLANEAGSLVVQKPETATLTPEELASVMRIENRIENVKYVPKLWGYEQWVENNEKYCCKILGLNKGYQCSLHYHKNKDETFLVTAGHVCFELGDEVMHLRPGSFVRVPPNTPHRFAGIEDSLITEISTHHEDSDSYRIEESRKMEDA